MADVAAPAAELYLAAGISEAEKLGSYGESLVTDLTADLFFDDAAALPGSALLLLERWAGLEFVAALLLLSNPPVAHTAIVLLRGMVEAWAHVHWISKGTDAGPDSRACRALCFWRGQAREMRDAISNADPRVLDDEKRDEAADRISRIDNLRTKLGCRRCDGRDHRDVLPTMREIAEESGVSWLPDMVRTTRMASHQLQPDRILRIAEDGVVEIGGPADLKERAALLQWVAYSYSSLLRVIARTLHPERETEIDPILMPGRLALGGVVRETGPL